MRVYRVQNSFRFRGKAWSRPYFTPSDAAATIRDEFGWDDVFVTKWMRSPRALRFYSLAFPTREERDLMVDAKIAPRIIRYD